MTGTCSFYGTHVPTPMKFRFIRRWVQPIVIALVIALGINQYGIALSIVNGSSMAPTLQDGDRLLVNKFTPHFSPPKIGDVITFEDPSHKGRYLVKRVIGIPGNTIEIKNGKLYRDGKVVEEPYVDTKIADGDFGPIKVKKGTVFVMGDNRNRNASRDSRYESVGLVSLKSIDGKVELIIWRPSLAAHL